MVTEAVVAGREGMLSVLSPKRERGRFRRKRRREPVQFGRRNGSGEGRRLYDGQCSDRQTPGTQDMGSRPICTEYPRRMPLDKRQDIAGVPRPGKHLIIVVMAETALIIDTHEDIQELVKSGMPEPQAETVVRQRVRLLEGNLATKAGIEKLSQETKAGIEKLRLETEAQIAATNANIETLRQETSGQIAETNARIETLRQETEKLIALCKVDIIKWVVGANLGIAAIVVAAVKLL